VVSAAAIAALIAPAWAARVEIDVQPRTVAVGQVVALSVQLIDGKGRGVPELAVGPGLRADFQGQSQELISVNFQSTRITRYTWALTAVEQGTWSVGPAKVQTSEGVLESAPVALTVGPRPAPGAARTAVAARLSDDSPVEGQVVVLEIEGRRAEPVYDAAWTFPSFTGFVTDKLAEATRSEARFTEGADEWTLETVRVPLIAAAAGPHRIDPVVYSVQRPAPKAARRRGGFVFETVQTTTETLASDPLPATVAPLPAEGRPADFAGLVGRFRLEVTPSTTALAVGESLTLDITLSGDGNLAGWSLPAPPPGSGWRAYDDAPVVKAALEADGYRAVARFRRAVVPDRAGSLTLPGLSLSVFDPDAGAYTRLESPPLTVDVRPGETGGAQVQRFGAAAEVPEGAPVEALADDILPAPVQVRVGDRRAAVPRLAAVALSGLGLAAAVGLTLARRPRSHRVEDPRAALRARLAALPGDPDDRLSALDALFRDAAALRIGCAPGAVTRGTIGALGPDALALFTRLEGARFAGLRAADIESAVQAFVLEATR
jgi:hypothetical protein